MMKLNQPVLLIAVFVLLAGLLVFAQPGKKKILVAHRGASAYAPEHTAAAYRLAIEQGADFVEQDLQITKDGVLVCLHDLTLERTTNVEELFPDRFHTDVTEDQPQTASPAKHWYVSDFTLAEIKKLDAGSWFNEKFKGERVQTWQEAIALVRGKAGMYPETKAPEVYGKRGFDMEKLLMESLRKNKLDQPNADPKTPLVIQSFSAASLRKLRDEYKTKLTLTFLIGGDPQKQWLTEDGLKKVKAFADGIGPSKLLLEREPKIVEWAHVAGLTVTPYTFRSANTGKFRDVREEMTHFLFTLGVDALFTDNPDQFPRR
ncbi:MAG TPA: glycerophosphodiester phosphodiesterase family protein [Blastocatellia bacterium]|jgi:glycerophosphoryl diester phosphodiesterase